MDGVSLSLLCDSLSVSQVCMSVGCAATARHLVGMYCTTNHARNAHKLLACCYCCCCCFPGRRRCNPFPAPSPFSPFPACQSGIYPTRGDTSLSPTCCMQVFVSKLLMWRGWFREVILKVSRNKTPFPPALSFFLGVFFSITMFHPPTAVIVGRTRVPVRCGLTCDGGRAKKEPEPEPDTKPQVCD